MTGNRPMIDPRTPIGRKAWSFVDVPTLRLLELLGIDPEGPNGRPHYSKAELCLMCAERNIKRPLTFNSFN